VIGIPRSIKKATSTPDVAFFVSGAKYRSQTPLREKVKLAAFIDRGVYFTLARTRVSRVAGELAGRVFCGEKRTASKLAG
jgi:hypothetical protein